MIRVGYKRRVILWIMRLRCRVEKQLVNVKMLPAGCTVKNSVKSGRRSMDAQDFDTDSYHWLVNGNKFQTYSSATICGLKIMTGCLQESDLLLGVYHYQLNAVSAPKHLKIETIYS